MSAARHLTLVVGMLGLCATSCESSAAACTTSPSVALPDRPPENELFALEGGDLDYSLLARPAEPIDLERLDTTDSATAGYVVQLAFIQAEVGVMSWYGSSGDVVLNFQSEDDRARASCMLASSESPWPLDEIALIDR